MRLRVWLLLLSLVLPALAFSQAALVNSHLVVTGSINACVSTSGTDDPYACTLERTVTAYETGTCYQFTADLTNTGPAAVNFSSLGAKIIKKPQGGITTDLVSGDIGIGQIVQVCYDGTNMQMISPLGNAGETVFIVGTPQVGQVAQFASGYGIEGVPTTGTGSVVRTTSPALETPTGLVKNDVGLGNVDNTSDATKNSDAVIVTNHRIDARWLPLSAATGTLTAVNADVAGADSYYRLDISGPLTFPCPSGTPAPDQQLTFYLRPATTPQTLTFTTGSGCFSAEMGLALPTTTLDDVTTVAYTFRYLPAPINRWVYSGGTKSTAPCVLADGCTGSALSDPGGHRLLGWDNTDKATKWITLGTGLSYDAPTDTLSATGGGGLPALRSYPVPAGNMETTGSCLVNGAAALVTNGPKLTTISCTNNDADSIEFELDIPDGWNGGTLTIELRAFSIGNNNTEVFEIDFAFQCVSSGDSLAAHSTTGEQAATIIWGNSTNRYQTATTSAITGNGSCAVGDTVYVRGQVDASATTMSPMTDLKILGVMVEWTRSAND